jgi:signal transduction histidine kinase/Na+/proline symporter/CheY-like chemotaxis protein
MQGIAPFVFAMVYAGLLFAFASWAESKSSARLKASLRLPAYALAIGVYCTSWTFYGAVGSAVADGWSYLPIYLGPILVFVFGRAFLVKMVDAVKADGANSISEFIGGRFGSSRSVAALVTLLALLGSIPYLALQLRSLSTTFGRVSGIENDDIILCVASALLALWAMLYGTRRYEASSRNDAVLFAVGFESLIKLAALLIVAGFALNLLSGGSPHIRQATLEILQTTFDPSAINADFFVITILSMAAIICLPRQFYIMVIEATSGKDVAGARWPFVAYMLATLLVVVPIAAAGIAFLPSATRPDVFVLELPLSQGANAIAILVFLGGFSAATAMVLVESIALATMVSNDLVAPALLRKGAQAATQNYGNIMLGARRIAICAIMSLALIWALQIQDSQRLASIGLVAFAAMAQFAPVLILSVYRANRDALAAKLSLSVGMLVWAYTLAIPQLLGPQFVAQFEGSLFNPYHLLGIGDLSPISHGAIWSLGANLLTFMLVTARRVQTSAFPTLLRSPNAGDGAQATRILDLKAMVSRFVGAEVTQMGFAAFSDNALVSPQSARTAERLIGGVVGLPTARALISSTLFGARLSPDEVSRLLDETGQSLRFSKDLLAATLEHIDPGVSVVDRDLNIVAWNTRYLEMFNYPPGMVYVGAPVSTLIAYNAARGECGPGEIDAHVARRLGHMRARQAHSFERTRPDGRVLKTVGGPMPSGGYVMCFSDITIEAQALSALKRARDELEARVEARTRDLQVANEALAHADADKTRFLAAASHDLLQPLHAARLFSSALARDMPDKARPLLGKLDLSIASADTLLRTLLDISKLDAGGVVPVPKLFPLESVLQELVETMAPLAGEKGLTLKLITKDVAVSADPTLLKSIVQNFLSNAIRYTEYGGVIVGVRRRGHSVRVDVIDTGPGIAQDQHQRIFREFERLPTAGGGGIGLGLAIVERIARLLDVSISMHSRVGKGSRFSVTLPISGPIFGPIAGPIAGDASLPILAPYRDAHTKARIKSQPLRILVVEDNLVNQDAMSAYLMGLGHSCDSVSTGEAALAWQQPFDVALVDFNLGSELDGLAVIEHLRQTMPAARYALVTAAPESVIGARTKAMDVPIFPKPVDPETLTVWLAQSAT